MSQNNTAIWWLQGGWRLGDRSLQYQQQSKCTFHTKDGKAAAGKWQVSDLRELKDGRRELRMTAFPSLGKLHGWGSLWEGEHAKMGGEINVVLKALSSFMQAGAAVCGEFRKQKYDSQSGKSEVER